jgi:hypothetical protein
VIPDDLILRALDGGASALAVAMLAGRFEAEDWPRLRGIASAWLARPLPTGQDAAAANAALHLAHWLAPIDATIAGGLVDRARKCWAQAVEARVDEVNILREVGVQLGALSESQRIHALRLAKGRPVLREELLVHFRTLRALRGLPRLSPALRLVGVGSETARDLLNNGWGLIINGLGVAISLIFGIGSLLFALWCLMESLNPNTWAWLWVVGLIAAFPMAFVAGRRCYQVLEPRYYSGLHLLIDGWTLLATGWFGLVCLTQVLNMPELSAIQPWWWLGCLITGGVVILVRWSLRRLHGSRWRWLSPQPYPLRSGREDLDGDEIGYGLSGLALAFWTSSALLVAPLRRAGITAQQPEAAAWTCCAGVAVIGLVWTVWWAESWRVANPRWRWSPWYWISLTIGIPGGAWVAASWEKPNHPVFHGIALLLVQLAAWYLALWWFARRGAVAGDQPAHAVPG